MGRIVRSGIKSASVFFALFLISATASGQSDVPDVFTEGSVREQMNYVQEKTRIYEDFRAIREDMFALITPVITSTEGRCVAITR